MIYYHFFFRGTVSKFEIALPGSTTILFYLGLALASNHIISFLLSFINLIKPFIIIIISIFFIIYLLYFNFFYLTLAIYCRIIIVLFFFYFIKIINHFLFI